MDILQKSCVKTHTTPLEIGETLKTLAGTSVVESRWKRKDPETVYNIEVEGDHVYRVGESGILVHNNSIPSRGELIRKAKSYRERTNMTNGAKNLGGIIYRKACKEELLKFTARFPESFVISDSTGHTEDQINQHLTSDPEIGNEPDSIDVLLLFTERSPCRRCSNTHIPDIERKNGGSIQDVVGWFVEHGAGSNRRLAIFYGFIEANE